MTEIPDWVIYFDVAKDAFITVIAGIGLITILYAKKQIDLIKNQTKETRNQFRIKNKRESISLAIQLSEKFPDIITRNDKLRNENFQLFNQVNKITKNASDKILDCNNCYKTLNQKTLITVLNILNPIGNKLLQIANEIEAISLYFVNGVADEESVFPALAPAFCNIFENVYPVLIKDRCVRCGKCETGSNNQRYELYQNSFKLYKKWKSRLLSSKASNDIESILSKQKSLELESQPIQVLGNNL